MVSGLLMFDAVQNPFSGHIGTRDGCCPMSTEVLRIAVPETHRAVLVCSCDLVTVPLAHNLEMFPVPVKTLVIGSHWFLSPHDGLHG